MANSLTRSKNTATRSQLVLIGVTLTKLCISLLITILLGRILDPGEFGFFSLVNTIFIVSRDLLDLGTGNVAAREIARNFRKEEAVLESLLGWRAVLGIVLAIICIEFAMQQSVDYQKWVLCSAAAVLAIMYLSAFNTVFQVRQAHEGPALLEIASQVSLLSFYAVLFWLQAATIFYPLLIVIREAVTVIGKKILAVRMLGYGPKPKFHGKEFRAFRGKALIFGMAALMYNIYFHSGTFLIWYFRPVEELGVYTAALRPIYPLLLFPWLLMVPLVPVLTQMAQNNGKRFVAQVKAILLVAIGIGAVGMVCGISLADTMLALLYGDKFIHGELSAIEAFRLFSIAFGFACVTPAFATMLLAKGKEKLLLKLTFLGLVINFSANIAFLPHFGYLAAAMSTVLTEVAVCFGGGLLIIKSLRPIQNGFTCSLVLYPAVFLGFCLQYLPDAPLIKVFCGALLSFAALYTLWLSPVSRKLRQEFSQEAGLYPSS